MKKLMVRTASFPYECHVKGKERPTVESDEWHGVTTAMVILQNDENVESIIILVKGMEIAIGNDDYTLMALPVLVVVLPLGAIIVAGGCAPPPSKLSFVALV
ncbi:hypothetical protein COCNU_07G010840 [Cocos nucifera]|uniref:Uncharacterized protein n=1 Tax=Cocos nucifera TaxID=13894 RepID=A0A8K0IG14_COCNU|nr:hypothetical protein COCNU_07G010840 [Cocos nucifera]